MNQGHRSFFSRIVFFSAASTIVVSVLGLLGYVPAFHSFGRIREDFIPMAPSTAISFIVFSGVLLCLVLKYMPKVFSIFLTFLTGLVSLFALLEVIGYFIEKDLNFEDRLLPDVGHIGEIPIGRMSPATGAVFFFVGLAVMILIRNPVLNKGIDLKHLAGILGSVVLAIGFVFLLAYAYGTPLLYGQGATVPMALTTALAFLMLGVAIVFSSGEENLPLRLVVGHSTRVSLLRFFLPLTVASVLFGSFVSLRVSSFSGFNPALASAAAGGVIAVLTGFLVSWAADHTGRLIDSARKALKASEEKFQDLYNEAPDMFVSVDSVNAKILECNETLARATGYTKEEIIGKPVFDMYHPDSLEGAKSAFQRFATTGVGDDVELALARKNGSKLDVSLKVSAVRDEQGNILTSRSAWRDITERKRAEQKLTKERSLLKAIIDQIPVMLTHYDPETKVLNLNKEFEKIIGWKTEEVQDIDMMKEFFPDPDYRQQALDYMQEASSEWREFHVQCRSGTTIPSEWSNIRLDDGTQIGIGIDITERKRNEEALKKLNAELEERVLERTSDLRKTVNLMAGRENRMADLKETLKRLRKQLEEAGISPNTDGPLTRKLRDRS